MNTVADSPRKTDSFGPNAWLVDEMYEQFVKDPSSVSESWQEFFEDYRSDTDVTPVAPGQVPARHRPHRRHRQRPAVKKDVPAPAAKAASKPAGDRRQGAAAAPKPSATADGKERRRTSRRRRSSPRASRSGVRPPASSPTWRRASRSRRPPASGRCPAKLLEVNRRVINGYLGRTRGGKVSFTHLIGYAVVRALRDAVPLMNTTFVEGDDGKPRVIRNEHVGLGLAVDVEKSDGSRTLLVPVHQGRRHARLPRLLGRLRGPHPQGPHQQARRPTTSPAPRSPSPTPARSAPSSRCRGSCPGQGVIVGVGAHRLPRRVPGRRPAGRWPSSACRRSSRSRSTYDHRIIQGAESGLFLKQVHELLLGERRLLRRRSSARSACPTRPVQWRRDVNPVDRRAGDAREADAGAER